MNKVMDFSGYYTLIIWLSHVQIYRAFQHFTGNIFFSENGAVNNIQQCMYSKSYNIRLCAGTLMQKHLTSIDTTMKNRKQIINKEESKTDTNFLLFPYDERLNEEQQDFCNTASGNSLDICGYCGNNKHQQLKVDRCGVCEGDNRCISCNKMIIGSKLDSCGNCLLEDDYRWNNCSKIIEVIPKVVDKVVNNGLIRIVLTKPPSNLSSLVCHIKQNDNQLVVYNITAEDEDTLLLLFDLANSEGEHRIECKNIDSDTDWGYKQFFIVNSLALSLQSISPQAIFLGQSVQVSLVVRNIATLLDLICYIMDNGLVVFSLPTNQIKGNPVLSTVICPTVKPLKATVYDVGVSYTAEAIHKMAGTQNMKLTVNNIPLRVTQAAVSPDLHRIFIEFNQNVIGPISCRVLFTEYTMQLFGNDPVCKFIGNTLEVKLGSGSQISDNQVLEFSAHNNIHSAVSYTLNTLETPSIAHLSAIKANTPNYRLIGLKHICSNNILKYSYMRNITAIRQNVGSETYNAIVFKGDSQLLNYNWTINFKTLNRSKTSSRSNQQRENLLIWFSAREISKFMGTSHTGDVISINTVLLVPDVQYIIEVTGKNSVGLVGEPSKLSFQLTDTKKFTKQLQLLILTTPTTRPYEDAIVEAKVFSLCDNNSVITDLQYKWELSSGNNTSLNMSVTNRAKLIIPGSELLPERVYNITCTLLRVISEKNVTILDVAYTQMKTLPVPKVEVFILPNELSLGTGHSIELHAVATANSYLLDNLQFSWKCVDHSSNNCLTPGSIPELLQHTNSAAFRKQSLQLNPRLLAVGRYLFTVTLYSQDMNVSVTSTPALVNVVPGNPPFIRIPYVPLLHDPGSGINIPAYITDITQGCQLVWSSVFETGFEYLDLKQLIPDTYKTVVGSTMSASKDFPLSIPSSNLTWSNMLKPDALYIFNLEVSCSASHYSYATVVIKVASPPIVSKLQVRPTAGLAMQTKFEFTTTPAYAPPEDHPLTYSFGYVTPTDKQYIFYTSNVWLTVSSFLPAFSSIGSKIITVLKVCNVHMICTISFGPTVKTNLTSKISEEQLSTIGKDLSVYMEQNQFNESISLASASLNTLRLLPDKSSYMNVSDILKRAVSEKITLVSQRLHMQNGLNTAICLLELTNNILPLLPKSDSLLAEVLSFRDKVLAMLKQKPRRPARAEFLTPEPRGEIRSKRQTYIEDKGHTLSAEMVQILISTSEAAILNFSSDEKSRIEKQKLLQNLDDYITDLCSALKDNRVTYISSKVASFSVQRLSISDSYKQILSVPACTTSCQLSAKITLNRSFLVHYKATDSVCLAGIVFPMDFLTDVYVKTRNIVLRRFSSIYQMKILTYSVPDKSNHQTIPSVKISIPLANYTTTENINLKCCVWSVDEWSDQQCETVKYLSTDIDCKCPAHQYYSIIGVPDNLIISSEILNKGTVNITTQPTEILVTQRISMKNESLSALNNQDLVLHNVHSVAFRFEDNFYTLVGQDKKEERSFAKSIENQLQQKLNVSKNIIKDVYVTPGSVTVNLSLNDSHAYATEEMILNLAALLSHGDLHLQGKNNSQLNIPAQGLVVFQKQENTEGFPVAVRAMVCLVILMFTIIFTLGAAIFIKYSMIRKMLQLSQKSEEILTPKYLHVHFEQSLNGTETALAKLQASSSNGYIVPSSVLCGEELDSGIFLIPDSDKVRTGEEKSMSSTKDSRELILKTSPLPGTPTSS